MFLLKPEVLSMMRTEEGGCELSEEEHCEYWYDSVAHNGAVNDSLSNKIGWIIMWGILQFHYV